MSEVLPWSESPAPALLEDGPRRGIHATLSPACMFAHTLSWAVRHGIPVDRAVLSMPVYLRESGRMPVNFLAYGTKFWKWIDPFPALLTGRYSFSRRLDDFVQEILRGAPLSCAMRDTLEGILPDYYIAGVSRAEAEGRLETALPALARQLELRTTLTEDTNAVTAELAVKACVTAAVLAFILVNVIPKFDQIFSELIEAGTPPAFSANVLKTIFWTTVGFFLGFALLVPAALSSSRRFDAFLMHIPFVRSLRRRALVADAALGMAALLRQGDDIVKAADWCVASARSQWMGRKLRAFAEAVRQGRPWDEAWAGMRIGDPLHLWFIRNAATLENPAAGFELLADWLRHEMDGFVRRVRMWIDPLGTVALAAIVAWVACTMFGTLVRIIYGLM